MGCWVGGHDMVRGPGMSAVEPFQPCAFAYQGERFGGIGAVPAPGGGVVARRGGGEAAGVGGGALGVENREDRGAVLISEKPGQEKWGVRPAGVGRKYPGTGGKITNALGGVYCRYATRHGHGLIDGDLYTQKAW